MAVGCDDVVSYPLLLRAALLRELEALRHSLCLLLPSLQIPELRAAVFRAAGHCVRAGKLDCRDAAAAQGDKQETSRRQPNRACQWAVFSDITKFTAQGVPKLTGTGRT